MQIAREERADLLVAGAYGHSRLGEWIFGGMARELLATALTRTWAQWWPPPSRLDSPAAWPDLGR
jgi:hypothetical protein